MHSVTSRSQYICARCLQRRQRRLFEAQYANQGSKFFSTLSGGSQAPSATNAAIAAESQNGEAVTSVGESHGAMSQRLEDLTEQSIQTGGRSAQKSVEEAGFSEELKRKLEAKLQESKFRSENPAAFATLDMPVRYPKMLPYPKSDLSSQAQEKEHATSPRHNRGEVPSNLKMLLCGCSTTPINHSAEPVDPLSQYLEARQ